MRSSFARLRRQHDEASFVNGGTRARWSGSARLPGSPRRTAASVRRSAWRWFVAVLCRLLNRVARGPHRGVASGASPQRPYYAPQPIPTPRKRMAQESKNSGRRLVFPRQSPHSAGKSVWALPLTYFTLQHLCSAQPARHRRRREESEILRGGGMAAGAEGARLKVERGG